MHQFICILTEIQLRSQHFWGRGHLQFFQRFSENAKNCAFIKVKAVYKFYSRYTPSLFLSVSWLLKKSSKTVPENWSSIWIPHITIKMTISFFTTISMMKAFIWVIPVTSHRVLRNDLILNFLEITISYFYNAINEF